MAQFDKHFTLDQANALLPWICAIFTEVHQLLDHVAADPAAPGNGPGGDPGAGAPPSAKVTPVWLGLERAEKIELVNRLLQALIEEGLLVQDVKRGLIDFPAWRQGEEVLLCYELSDGARIVAWHAIHTGYAGRQPLDEAE